MSVVQDNNKCYYINVPKRIVDIGCVKESFFGNPLVWLDLSEVIGREGYGCYVPFRRIYNYYNSDCSDVLLLISSYHTHRVVDLNGDAHCVTDKPYVYTIERRDKVKGKRFKRFNYNASDFVRLLFFYSKWRRSGDVIEDVAYCKEQHRVLCCAEKDCFIGFVHNGLCFDYNNRHYHYGDTDGGVIPYIRAYKKYIMASNLSMVDEEFIKNTFLIKMCDIKQAISDTESERKCAEEVRRKILDIIPDEIRSGKSKCSLHEYEERFSCVREKRERTISLFGVGINAYNDYLTSYDELIAYLNSLYVSIRNELISYCGNISGGKENESELQQRT